MSTKAMDRRSDPSIVVDRSVGHLRIYISQKLGHFSANATASRLHPPSEAAGRVGNRAFSEFAGEGLALHEHQSNGSTERSTTLFAQRIGGAIHDYELKIGNDC
jgi:hypothetical protein